MGIPNNAELVYEGRVFKVYEWDQKQFDGSTKRFEAVDRPNVVLILPVVEDGVYIIEDEQPGRDETIMTIPGGWIKEGQSPLEAAKIELVEETGMVFEDLELFDQFNLSSKVHQYFYIYIARNLVEQGEQSVDIDGERIRHYKVSFKKFFEMLLGDKFHRRAYRELHKLVLMILNHDEKEVIKFLNGVK